jgi:hypothetical protein
MHLERSKNCMNVFLTTPSLHLTWKSLPGEQKIVNKGCTIDWCDGMLNVLVEHFEFARVLPITNLC